MNKKVILIIDSCSGELSILKYIKNWRCDYEIIYVADYEKNPLGLRSRKEIVSIVKSWFVNLVRSNKVKMVIIACNTASVAIKTQKEKLSKIFKVPVVTMIEGIKNCIRNNKTYIKDKNVAIMVTKYTIESEEYSKIVKRYHPKKIIEIIATKCEREVAKGTYNSVDGKKNIVSELQQYRYMRINTVILACTCFKTINKQIKKIFGNKVICLDPVVEVSKLSKEALKINKNRSKSKIIIYNTAKNRESKNSIRVACRINIKKIPRINFLQIIR